MAASTSNEVSQLKRELRDIFSDMEAKKENMKNAEVALRASPKDGKIHPEEAHDAFRVHGNGMIPLVKRAKVIIALLKEYRIKVIIPKKIKSYFEYVV